jgi:hypothetical protein
MKCNICRKEEVAEDGICQYCMRKIGSKSYMIEYCINCLEIICLSQEKADKGKYKEYKGRCPKCKYEN